jgi:hypothetical protein
MRGFLWADTERLGGIVLSPIRRGSFIFDSTAMPGPRAVTGDAHMLGRVFYVRHDLLMTSLAFVQRDLEGVTDLNRGVRDC